MSEFRISTTKRVCFWGAASCLPPSTRVVSECMMECGQNTGNLFIGNGLFEATDAPIKEYWNFYNGTPEEFNERFDYLFVPASNFIFQHTDLQDQYAFFRKTKAQIFMFGLGSQLRELKDVKLPQGTEDFIRLAAERSGSIGVRGNITAEIVRKMGISNVDVVGCPSLLKAPNDCSPPPAELDSNTILAGNFTTNARDHAFSADNLRKTEGALFSELVNHGGYYVLQNERHEIALRRILADSAHLNDAEAWELHRVYELFDNRVTKDNLLSYLRWNAKLFFSTREWIRFMTTVDFSFGTRFHGNVAAILAGRPAYILCHDYRTLELCEFYGLPHRIIDAYSPVVAIDQLMHDCDMLSYSRNRTRLEKVWARFVTRNGLSPTIATDIAA